MAVRITEREVLCKLLKELELPFSSFSIRKDAKVVFLSVSPTEWDQVRSLVQGPPRIRVQEVCEAWRQLPPAIWTDEYWGRRVCMRVCSFAIDCDSLIPGSKLLLSSPSL